MSAQPVLRRRWCRLGRERPSLLCRRAPAAETPHFTSRPVARWMRGASRQPAASPRCLWLCAMCASAGSSLEEIGPGVNEGSRVNWMDSIHGRAPTWRHRWGFLICSFLFILILKYTNSFFDVIAATVLGGTSLEVRGVTYIQHQQCMRQPQKNLWHLAQCLAKEGISCLLVRES